MKIKWPCRHPFKFRADFKFYGDMFTGSTTEFTCTKCGKRIARFDEPDHVSNY